MAFFESEQIVVFFLSLLQNKCKHFLFTSCSVIKNVVWINIQYSTRILIHFLIYSILEYTCVYILHFANQTIKYRHCDMLDAPLYLFTTQYWTHLSTSHLPLFILSLEWCLSIYMMLSCHVFVYVLQFYVCLTVAFYIHIMDYYISVAISGFIHNSH